MKHSIPMVILAGAWLAVACVMTFCGAPDIAVIIAWGTTFATTMGLLAVFLSIVLD